MITISGIQIHEFSIAITDFVIFVESVILAYLLYKQGGKKLSFKTIYGLGSFLFLFLGASSLLGALFHAFFPGKAESLGGFIMWMFTTASIGLIAVTILYTTAFILKNRYISKSINIITVIFFLCYMYTILFVDYHYPTVIKFYGPTILLLGAVGLWKSITQKKAVWFYLLTSSVLSVVAAIIQSLHISIDPVYLNFNTLYHIIQGIAFVFLYFFFRKYPNDNSG